MVILSVDYGDVRTGIAVCDKSEFLASPVTVITERNPERLAEKISSLAVRYEAQMIVVGLPKNMDGTEGPRAALYREFAGLLEEKTGMPVILWDERRTTIEAHQILTESNYHGKKRRNTVDAVAASLILEGYLSFKNRENSLYTEFIIAYSSKYFKYSCQLL